MLCTGDIPISDVKGMYNISIFDHFPLCASLDLAVERSLENVKDQLINRKLVFRKRDTVCSHVEAGILAVIKINRKLVFWLPLKLLGSWYFGCHLNC